jgi:4-hydroxybenzoate polyprenyltransferase
MSTSDHTASTRPLDLIEAMSVFSACYAAGGIVLVSMLLGVAISFWSVAAAFSITWFVYLLHRTRMAARRNDEMFVRDRLLRRHVRLVTVVLCLSGAMSLLSAVMTSPWLALLLPASVLGMLLYGMGADGRRLRDRLVVKNACVGLSMACFWVMLAIAPDHVVFEVTSAVWTVLAAMVLLVLSDAMYCDLGDMAADAHTLSRTAPIQWGSGSTRWTADVCVVLVALLVVLSDAPGPAIPSLWFIVPMLLLLSQGVLRLVAPHRIRAVIDARLLLLAVVGAGLATWISSTT